MHFDTGVRSLSWVLGGVQRPSIIPSSGSMLTSLIHELGHSLFKGSNPKPWDVVGGEAFTIEVSVGELHKRGFEQPAREEVAAASAMAKDRPYRSAVTTLRGRSKL